MTTFFVDINIYSYEIGFLTMKEKQGRSGRNKHLIILHCENLVYLYFCYNRCITAFYTIAK